MAKEKIYPVISISLIKNPKRFYAIPILGGLVKIFMLIPVGFFMLFLSIAVSFTTFINSFFVLFSGKYWKTAYELNVLLLHIAVKSYFFFTGLTNRYPGFSGELLDFTIDIPYPTKPNRWFAVPLFGGVVRIILMIPFFVYNYVISYAANFGAYAASFVVLFKGKYPESFYEINCDAIRQGNSMSMYFAGLEDTYPSWWISMNHKTTKIILIVLAVLYLLFNNVFRPTQPNSNFQQQQFQKVSPATTSNGFGY